MEIQQCQDFFDQHCQQLQDAITKQLQLLDPLIELREDPWQWKDHLGREGGGGRTRAFQGKVIENAGVNISRIYGAISPEFARQLNAAEEDQIWACGLSLIIHPRSPKIPTVHANFRMLILGEKKVWFGGGADLTPYFPHQEDFLYFHRTWKEACAPFGTYSKMKRDCDEYFVNTHRNHEMRGVGGIFFDHFNSGDLEKDWKMVKNLSNHFIQSWFPLAEKRVTEEWTPADEDFQLHRRGRYVEFNLLHDRGTSFGLRSQGRTDSILISLPARCTFTYRYQPETGSPQEEMMDYYYPRDWF